MEDILPSILRTSLAYVVLLTVTLLCGKQINSHKNYFNFALSVTIGAYIGNMGFDTNLKFTPMLFSFGTLTILYFLSSFISLKSRKLRKWLSGQPTVLIENGKILDDNMRKSRLSLDDLNQLLREQGIFDIAEAEYALLEISGNVSVLKKEQYKNVTKKDLSPAYMQQPSVPVELMMEGKVIEKNLTSMYNYGWIHNECQKRNIAMNEVYYAVIGTDGQLYMDLYRDSLSSPVDAE